MWYLRGVYLIINTKILAKNDNRLGAIGDIIFTIKKENIDEDLAIFAGDNIFTYSLTDMYAFFKEKNALTLIAINVPDVEQRRDRRIKVDD